MSEAPPHCINEDLDDEGDVWVPLEPDMEPMGSSFVSIRDIQPKINRDSSPTRMNIDNDANLRRLQCTLETKSKLKQSLLDHPIEQAWQRFLVHLIRELWELDLSIRLGAVLTVVGTVFQAIVMATFFPWYDPRSIVVVIVFAVSWFYLLPTDPQALVSMIRLHRFTTTQIRCLFLVTFLIPTWLEARTLGFLTQVVHHAGWGYNIFATAVIAGVIAYRRRKNPLLSPRHHYYASINILYGCALWISLLHFNIRNIPSTAGPFLLSSGTLLLSRADQQQFSRALRHTMRLTLRDTLATLSDNVQQDEMLQLAMLRWIVDYWSTKPEAHESSATQPSAPSNPSSSDTPQSVPVLSDSASPVLTTQTGRNHPFIAGPRLENTATHKRQRSSRQQSIANAEEIQWSDLMPMLNITAHQMEEEIPHVPNHPENNSLHNFTQMLMSMDVDEHAKPAVDAYKRAVQDFPPSRETALFISVLRRSPASLVLIWRYLMASALAFPSTISLMPFIILEIHRVLQWAKACHESMSPDRQEVESLSVSLETITSIPLDLDSMTLLFSPENYSALRSPTLLQVWLNIQSSVHALEAGLVAARCAHTTVAAAEFADNLMSLAQFGFEVSQKGWLHGLVILTTELMAMHAVDGGAADAQEGRYTSAAKGALRNSQVISRNFQVLVEEDAPIIGFLQAIVGRGWLWGRDDEKPTIPESTVTITELNDDGEEINSDEPDKRQKEGTESTTLLGSEAEVKEIMGMEDVGKHGLISEQERSSFTANLQKPSNKDELEGIKRSLSAVIQEEEARIKEMEQEDNVTGVTQMLLSAHDRGLIGDAQRCLFESIIAGQPDKIPLIKNTLTSIIEKEPPLKDDILPVDENLCEARDLIDSTFAKGLIQEAEKCSFTSILEGAPEKGAVDAVERSLQAVIDEDETRQLKEPLNVNLSDARKLIVTVHKRGLITDAEKKSFEETICETDDRAIDTVKNALGVIQDEADDGSREIGSSEDEAVPFLNFQEQGPSIDVDGADILPAIFSTSSWDATSPNNASPGDEIGDSQSWEASATQKIQPTNSARLTQELTSRLQGEEDEISPPKGENGEDWMKWVGGGLAVIGAVVGTVAMHKSNQDEEERQRNDGSRTNSGGRVVELRSEMDDDGWVSVSETH